jgi:hypothetical protein
MVKKLVVSDRRVKQPCCMPSAQPSPFCDRAVAAFTRFGFQGAGKYPCLKGHVPYEILRKFALGAWSASDPEPFTIGMYQCDGNDSFALVPIATNHFSGRFTGRLPRLGQARRAERNTNDGLQLDVHVWKSL